MRNLLVALFLLPTLALAQQYHTFNNGEVADAEKINQTHQYILNNASGGGCSASQQDNSVLIQCADGTSGVIAGAGTVALPQGFTGEVDLQNINSGDIVVVDEAGTVLSLYAGTRGDGYIVSIAGSEQFPGPYIGIVGNPSFSPSVGVQFSTYELLDDFSGLPYSLYFSGGDGDGDSCNDPSSAVFSNRMRDESFYENPDKVFPEIVEAPNGNYYVHTGERLGATLFNTALVGEYDGLDSYTWTCRQGEFVVNPEVLVEFTLPPEILNAIEPVRLEQLP